VIRGLGGIALSTPRDSREDTWQSACRFVGHLFEPLLQDGAFQGLLNVNVPELPRLRGYRWTRLGKREYREEADVRKDPKGREYYWIGGPGISDFQDATGEDVAAVRDGYISVTPLQLDMTSDELLEELVALELEGWAAGAGLDG
jgi:5'-nucleotidase